MVKRPRIFVCSTIYDFSDLRSALKFYLESLGCEVYLSEYNDFPKPLDVNSYEACLATIQRAHYFILLIGDRYGGIFEPAGKADDAALPISITRQEYRTAYGLAKQRRLKIVTF